MAISVVLVSLDSSEDSVRISARRVILFGTIPTTISDTTPTISPPATHTDTAEIPTIATTTPLSPDYTPSSPDYSPAPDIESDPSEDPPSDHILPLEVISPIYHSSPDLLSTSARPSRKRRRDSGYLADVEVDPRETSLRDDVIVRGIDARVVVEHVDREESKTGTRGPVE
nr:hypothetical protein [Tanacetum cinerariifolium]